MEDKAPGASTCSHRAAGYTRPRCSTCAHQPSSRAFCCRLFIISIHYMPRWRSSSVHGSLVSDIARQATRPGPSRSTCDTTVDKRSRWFSLVSDHSESAHNARSRAASRSIRRACSTTWNIESRTTLGLKLSTMWSLSCQVSMLTTGLQPSGLDSAWISAFPHVDPSTGV